MDFFAAEDCESDTIPLVAARGRKRETLARFEEILKSVKDPRRKQGQRYPLRSVVLTALCAMVCGADDAQALQVWGEVNQAWLAEFLDLPHGVPTQDVFLAVFAALDPKEFSLMFRSWVMEMSQVVPGAGKHIAVDGKTSRRSFDKGRGKAAIHTVSAWLCDSSLVVGQIQTEAKSNEITAIPELLKQLDLKGTTVTIDAIGCQTDIANVIVDKGGYYLLAVKDNQPTLHQEVKDTFVEAHDPRRRAIDEEPRPHLETFVTVEKSHGRLEERTVNITRNLSWLQDAARWKNVSVVVEVKSKRTELATDKTSHETRHYIGNNLGASAEQAGNHIRRHWSIENELHWVLDMAFNEDQARHRAKNTADNFAILRHFAINLLKSEKTIKVGVANKRKRAGWSKDYLFTIIAGSGV